MKKCPKCSIEHEDSVVTCDCGYEFTDVVINEKDYDISIRLYPFPLIYGMFFGTFAMIYMYGQNYKAIGQTKLAKVPYIIGGIGYLFLIYLIITGGFIDSMLVFFIQIATIVTIVTIELIHSLLKNRVEPFEESLIRFRSMGGKKASILETIKVGVLGAVAQIVVSFLIIS